MNLFDMPPVVTHDQTDRAAYERDGLPVAWALYERKYIAACESHRLGRSHVAIPRQLIQSAARRSGGNKRNCTGVAWHKGSGRWWAYRPMVNGGRYSLGYHATKCEALRAVEKDRERRKQLEAVA